MSDPYVREIGRVEIPGGPPLIVSISHGAVDIGRPALAIDGRLAVQQADHLAALLITACWQASAHPCPADCGSPVHDQACTPLPEGTASA